MIQKIKVLHYVSRMDRAGQETFIMNVFRNIDRSSIFFGFLCSEDGEGDYDNEIESLGGEIEHVKLNRINNKLKQIDNFILLNRKLREMDYDVFHIHTQHAMDAFFSSLAAKLAGIKHVVVHSHNTSTDFHIKAHFLFRPFLNILGVKKFACSVAAGKWMFKNAEATVVHNGIDLNDYKLDRTTRENIRKQYNINGKIVFGHVGRFSRQKNHHKLINIFNSINNLNNNSVLFLIGEGPLKPEIINLVHKNGLDENVFFLGVRDDVNELYKAMDAFLLPSLYEGLSVALVEAQAAGLKCYVSDKISKESDITSNIRRINIDENSEYWAEKILKDIQSSSEDYSDSTSDVKKSGYDIKDVSRLLELEYQNMCM